MLKIAKLLYGVHSSDIQMAQVPQMTDIIQKNIPKYGDVLIPNVLAVRQFVHQQLDMKDTVTATPNEQYYWNLYTKRNVNQHFANHSPTAISNKSTKVMANPSGKIHNKRIIQNKHI